VFPRPGTTRTPGGLRGDPDAYGELLVTPITLERVQEVAKLDGMREELLKEAKKIEDGTKELRVMQEKALEAYNQTSALQKKLIAEYTELQKEKRKKRSDNATPRNLNFNTTTKPMSKHVPEAYVDHNGQEVMTTPKDNLRLAKHLLDVREDPIAIDKPRYLINKAVNQQEKANTSQKLASDPNLCQSTARDHQSRTGSTERRRKEAKNHPDPIPVSSSTAEKGKEPMYKG
jgi:hypothetical protein